ncbi:MAG: hypothetical protein EOL95_09225 [Bacteroidia bacterium]|nr:hypothetical protein [Bacteroidia bacterium]
MKAQQKQRLLEEVRQSKLIEKIYEDFNSEEVSVLNVQMVIMGLQAVIGKKIEEQQSKTKIEEFGLAKVLDPKIAEHRKYIKILEELEGESVMSSLKIIKKFEDLINASLDRKNDGIILRDLDIYQLMQKYEETTK